MAFQTIGFIGLGLIGGSIAKKMKSNQPDIKIYATAHHKETIQEAYREGLIENNDLLPLSAFSDLYSFDVKVSLYGLFFDVIFPVNFTCLACPLNVEAEVLEAPPQLARI